MAKGERLQLYMCKPKHKKGTVGFETIKKLDFDLEKIEKYIEEKRT